MHGASPLYVSRKPPLIRSLQLNEFRKFLNLKPFTKFTEVRLLAPGGSTHGADVSGSAQHNSNPAVASAMERCYVHPDNIELVGLPYSCYHARRLTSFACVM